MAKVVVLEQTVVVGLVSTLAGKCPFGFADGQGTTARFADAAGICIDTADVLYVADGGNKRIRKISVSGDISVYFIAVGSNFFYKNDFVP